MAVPPSLLLTACTFLLLQTLADGLGSATTVAVVYGSGAACGIVAGEAAQRVRCYGGGNDTISVLPDISFQEISGGQSFFCGLRRGGLSLLCWDGRFRPKRIYRSDAVRLTDLTVGDDQVCARESNKGVARCWRGGGWGGGEWSTSRGGDGNNLDLLSTLRFRKITCGSGFVCGILRNNGRVLCWGTRRVGEKNAGAEIQIQSGFGNLSMSSLVAGESHACGLTVAGALICKGSNNSGQLNVPSSLSASFESSGLALGANFTCALRRGNGLVTCWGDRDGFEAYSHGVFGNVSFETIVAGMDFVCGLRTSDLSVICWGPGWSSSRSNGLPIGKVIPGPCVRSSCGLCGVYVDSEILCRGSGNICKLCQAEFPLAAPLPPVLSPSVSESSKNKRKLMLAFLIVGLVGSLVGFCILVFCIWTRISHRLSNWTTESNSVSEHDLDVAVKSGLSSSATISSEAIHQTVGRRKSKSLKPETFSLSELAVATDNFSSLNRIGSGSFGVVYRGSLSDGREVAVKRGHSRTKRSFHEKETAFESELALLSRLHHKHLVSLLGFCDANDDRLLVYDYMPNGSLHHHLHSNSNSNDKSVGVVLGSWKTRIRIALEAARGIEYLHNYAVPPIIHRDIKSSNILLDSDMTAKVSDFGLSMAGYAVSAKAVGTMGYIDPEYYVLNMLTTKSDVYGLGVVMLELLTGKRAVFRSEGGGCEIGVGVTSVVEYAARGLVLDERMAEAVRGSDEARAVEVLAATAMRCVRLEGDRRPSVSEVVASLETAYSLCQ